MQTSFHARFGDEFLGLRLSRRGQIEVVYDDGAHQRRIWRLAGAQNAQRIAEGARDLADALRIAADDARVLARLQVELDRREIALENILH